MQTQTLGQDKWQRRSWEGTLLDRLLWICVADGGLRLLQVKRLHLKTKITAFGIFWQTARFPLYTKCAFWWLKEMSYHNGVVIYLHRQAISCRFMFSVHLSCPFSPSKLHWPLLGGGVGSRWFLSMTALYWACSEGKRTRTPRTDAADVSPGTSRRRPAQPWPAARWLDTQTHTALSDRPYMYMHRYNIAQMTFYSTFLQ